jgi:virginiamycin B lyase
VWFTELTTGKLGRIDSEGHVIEFSLRSRSAQPYALALGPTGNMWFTEYGADTVGYVDSRGEVTEYRLPTRDASPAGIALGADGNMWVAESSYGASKLAKVTSRGVITEYRLPTAGAQPFGIAPSGHSLWVTEFGSGKIASADLSGHFTEYRVPTASATPFHLIVIPGGQVWFTEPSTNQLGRLTLQRGHTSVVEYPLPAQAAALDVAPGPHGTLWTTEFMLDSLGVFTP